MPTEGVGHIKGILEPTNVRNASLGPCDGNDIKQINGAFLTRLEHPIPSCGTDFILF